MGKPEGIAGVVHQDECIRDGFTLGDLPKVMGGLAGLELVGGITGRRR